MLPSNLIQLWPHLTFIAGGIGVTLQYALCSVTGGFILGTLLALAKVSPRHKVLKCLAHIYTSVFRGTPLLVQLSIVYFGLPGLLGIPIDPFAAGILAFSLNSGAYVSEIIYGGIRAVDKGQREAAMALGASERQTMVDIILPQAIRMILPALVNEIVNLIKESSLISIIGEADIMRRAQLISAENYSYFEPLLIAAGYYYILVMALSGVAVKLKQRLNRYDTH